MKQRHFYKPWQPPFLINLWQLNTAAFCLSKSPSAALSSIAAALAAAQSFAPHRKICSTQSAAIFSRLSNKSADPHIYHRL